MKKTHSLFIISEKGSILSKIYSIFVSSCKKVSFLVLYVHETSNSPSLMANVTSKQSQLAVHLFTMQKN